MVVVVVELSECAVGVVVPVLEPAVSEQRFTGITNIGAPTVGMCSNDSKERPSIWLLEL
jgi:hypothetical protein